MPPNELFLSYSGLDRTFANSVIGALHHHAIPLWDSETNLVGGQHWHDEVGEAMQRCDWFAVILSPHALASMWVKRELMFALDEPRLENKILPLLYQSCNLRRLSWTLSSVQMVDFTGDFHVGCRELLRIWGIDYSQH
ncbi:MAG TPA: toll/interleukin-1 receptor domain-containing protein [Pyrinomonadaceae bacterium]